MSTLSQRPISRNRTYLMTDLDPGTGFLGFGYLPLGLDKGTLEKLVMGLVSGDEKRLGLKDGRWRYREMGGGTVFKSTSVPAGLYARNRSRSSSNSGRTGYLNGALQSKYSNDRYDSSGRDTHRYSQGGRSKPSLGNRALQSGLGPRDTGYRR